MLRFVQVGNSLPVDWPVDPTATFQPGQVGQLHVIGNNIVCGVSDGTAPIGIIDSIRTTSFTAPSIDEVVIVPAVGTEVGNKYVSVSEIKVELLNPNIIASSFMSDPVDVELIARNGVVAFPVGTELNIDQDGDGIPDGIRTVVNYTYQIPNIPGDDSTQGSGRITIWFQKMLFQTDVIETNQRYPLNANLFVSEAGLLTTRSYMPDLPGVGIVTAPPNSIHGMLEALWL